MIILLACETNKKKTSGRLYDYKIINYADNEDSTKNKKESYIFNDSLNVITVNADLNNLKVALHLKSHLNPILFCGLKHNNELKYTNKLQREYLDKNPMLLLINDTIRDFGFPDICYDRVLPRSISSIKKADKIYVQIFLDVFYITSNSLVKPYLFYVILLELDKNGKVISTIASLATRAQINEEDFFKVMLKE